MLKLIGNVVKGVVGLFMLLILFATIAASQKDRSVGSPGAVPPTAAAALATVPAGPVRPDVATSAKAVIKAYDANEVAADAVYKGKRVRVLGEIKNIGKDVMDNPYLSFGEAFKSLNCYFSKEHSADLATLHKGDLMVVDGECRGLTIGSVILKECSTPTMNDIEEQTPEILPKGSRPKKK